MPPRVEQSRDGGPTTFGVVGSILEFRDRVADDTDNGIGAQVGRAVCNSLSSVGFDGIPLNNRTGPGFICEPYWADSGIDPPVDQVPFQGGQCSDLRYVICADVDVLQNEGDTVRINFCTSTGTNIYGPISYVGVDESQLNEANRSRRVIAIGRNGSGTAPVTAVLVSSTVNRYSNVGGVVVSTRGGEPDICGDPPSVSVPGPNNPDTPYGQPQPVPGYPGVEITVNPPVIYEGDDIYWPVDITFEGEPIGTPIRFDPKLRVPEIPDPVIEGEPTEPTEPSGDVEDSPDPDESAEGLEVIGYAWQFLGTQAFQARVVNTQPVVYTRIAGNLQLKMRSQNGDVFYGDNLVLRSERGTLIRSDESLEVIGVSYNRVPEIQGIRLTPLKARGKDGR